MLPQTLPLAASLMRPSPGRRQLVAGVLSGTSADGIDVVLAEAIVADEPPHAPRLAGLEVAAFATEPFEPSLRARLRRVLDGEAPTLGEIAALHRDLGLAFGTAARRVANRHDVGELVLVASHGQTVFHHDGAAGVGRATLQLGDGDFVAESSGVGVVSDFRQRDCAAGGEGAPLVTLVDDVLFGAAPRPLAILNLGGIANWTLLFGDGDDRGALGFDVGPAGALLDGLSRRLLGCPFDDGGRAARGGAADDRLVSRWLGHPFLAREGPRSTGRDTFGEPFIDRVVHEAAGMEPADVLRTACRFIAVAAGRALERALAVPGVGGGAPIAGAGGAPGGGWSVALAGGGARNAALADELDAATRMALSAGVPSAGVPTAEAPSCGSGRASFGTTASLGVPPDAREALAFAALGVRLVLGEPSTSRAVTGAAAGRVLGKWSPPARDLPASP